MLTGGWQTDRETRYVALTRAREQTDIYASREDLGHQGIDTDAISRLAQRTSKSHAQQASISRERVEPEGAPSRAVRELREALGRDQPHDRERDRREHAEPDRERGSFAEELRKALRSRPPRERRHDRQDEAEWTATPRRPNAAPSRSYARRWVASNHANADTTVMTEANSTATAHRPNAAPSRSCARRWVETSRATADTTAMTKSGSTATARRPNAAPSRSCAASSKSSANATATSIEATASSYNPVPMRAAGSCAPLGRQPRYAGFPSLRSVTARLRSADFID